MSVAFTLLLHTDPLSYTPRDIVSDLRFAHLKAWHYRAAFSEARTHPTCRGELERSMAWTERRSLFKLANTLETRGRSLRFGSFGRLEILDAQSGWAKCLRTGATVNG